MIHREVAGFPGYAVGTDGVVWSRWGSGCGGKMGNWFALKSSRSDYGRVSVNFRFPDGVRRRVVVHKIVLEAFVGPCPDGMEGCHWNDRSADNRLDNVRWGTRQSNVDDRGRNGRTAIGERNGSAKLNPAKVRDIRGRPRRGETHESIAFIHGVSSAMIGYIANGKYWAHVA